MAPNILLNGELYKPNLDDLPCLIHGHAKAGASEFTVSYLADLFHQGTKLLFISGFPMAQKKFVDYVEPQKRQHITLVQTPDELVRAAHYQAILPTPGNYELLSTALIQLPDITERVVILKNFELLTRPEILLQVLKMPKWILSGNLDQCVSADLVLTESRNTTVLFSPTRYEVGFMSPHLSKYQGYLQSTRKSGEITVSL